MLFSRKNDLKEFNSRHRSWGLHLWHTLELDSSADIKQIISEYQNLAEIEVAEPVYKKTLLWVPNDSGSPNNGIIIIPVRTAERPGATFTCPKRGI